MISFEIQKKLTLNVVDGDVGSCDIILLVTFMCTFREKSLSERNE